MKITNILNPNNTLSVNRPLAHAIGVNAAIVFAALIAKQAYYEEQQMLDDSGYFYSTIDDLEESTALSFNKQKKALDVLVDVGLIDFCVKGVPPRRYFKIVDDETALANLLDIGSSICKKVENQFAENSQINLQESDNSIFEKIENQFSENLKIDLSKNKNPIYKTKDNKTKENKSKDNNPQSSKPPTSETKDLTDRTEGMTDFQHNNSNSFVSESSEREKYLNTIHENIGYDSFPEKEVADELVGIMADVLCSRKATVRVNGEELPTEQVKKRFLELKKAHIEHVLNALESNAGNVRNIRAYLITALYNAPTAVYSAASAHNNPPTAANSNAPAHEKPVYAIEPSFDMEEVFTSIKARYKQDPSEDDFPWKGEGVNKWQPKQLPKYVLLE